MSEALRTLAPEDPPTWDSHAARALARDQFDSLERWLCSEEVGVMGLRGVEIGEELRGRELLRLLLQAHVEWRGDGDVGPAIEVLEDRHPDGVELYTHKRMHLRRIVTIFGEVCVRRLGYGMPGKTSIHPLDATATRSSGAW